MDFWESRVLFIDGEAIVIDKPAGLAVHPGSRTPESLDDDFTRHLSNSFFIRGCGFDRRFQCG